MGQKNDEVKLLKYAEDEINNDSTWLEYVLFRFRWIFVLTFILPMSVAYDLYSVIRNWIVFQLQSAPKWHRQKVTAIQRQIQEWHQSGQEKKLCTARSGHLTMCFRYPKYKEEMIGIRTDKLVDILEIDQEKLSIRVEPMVTMGQLTRYLIPLGYTLPIVPELDDLTVGGMINGCGIESSGIRYGLFQHNCISYEVVTTSGELVESNSKHQSLYYGIPWSHGTLGFLVAATLKIIPVKKLVKLTYIPCHSQEDIGIRLTEESKNLKNDFVEGIQFTKNSGVVMFGSMVDQMPKNKHLNAIGRWYKPWFFKHVEKIFMDSKKAISINDKKTDQPIHTEYIPIRDYYHRHSRSIFWEIQDLIQFGNHPIFRYLFGWATPPKISLLKMTMPEPVKNIYDRHHMIQDLLLPIDKLDEGVDLLNDEVSIYPLWLCPFNLPSQPGMIRNRTGTNRLYIDIGIYGNCKLNKYNPIETTRRIEKYVRSVQGIQMLYADCYQSVDEFWEMFDSSLYDWLRAKYDCKQALPTVYEKVCRNARL